MTTELTRPTDGATPQPLVEIKDLVKWYRRRDGAPVKAIDDISIDVQPGEFIVLLGPSGCGKTTLLRCIAGLEEPDSGLIRMRGQDFYAQGGRTSVPVEKRNLSMVFQSYALWPHMTVHDNVAFPLRNRGVTKSEVKRRVQGALAKVGISDLEKSYPTQISGGQQQRVALARALVTNDQLILFDEPLSNVDARVRDELRFELLEMQREIGFAAIYVTHDQNEAMALADQIAVLGNGKVLQLGSPEDIYQRPASRRVAAFVGNANELPGQVVSTSPDGRLVVDTVVGKVVASAGPDPLTPGDETVLIWRPEHGVTTTDPSTGGENVWSADVLASVYVGTHTESDLSLGDVKQRVWNFGRTTPPEGQAVGLHVDPAHLLAYPG